MKIALLKNNKICYSSLQYFLQEIEKVLRYRRIETVEVDTIDDGFMAQKWDAVIGINQETLSVQLKDGDFLFDYLHCPLFAIIVDPPYHHDKLLRVHSRNMHLICLDEGHVKYAQEYYGPFQSVEMGYLLGAIQEPLPYRDREIDLLFTGTLPNKQKICDKVYSYKQRWAEDLFDYLIAEGKVHPNISMQAQVLDYFRQMAMHVSREDYKLAMAMVGIYAEHYLRADYRERIIEMLLQAGIPVTIVGDGWEEFKKRYPRELNLRSGMELSQISSFTANSKIALNIMPWFKDGLHDRIPTSMYNGAVCLTDGSTYIKSHFTDGENLVLYDLADLMKLPDKVQELLEYPDKAMKIAQNGYQYVQTEYSWEKFVAERILRHLTNELP